MMYKLCLDLFCIGRDGDGGDGGTCLDDVGAFPPVGTHSPHSIAAVRTFDNACKDVLKAALVFW